MKNRMLFTAFLALMVLFGAVGAIGAADPNDPEIPVESERMELGEGPSIAQDDEELESPQSVTTSSATYDATVLSKFIPGSAFVPYVAFDDEINYVGTCHYANSASLGSVVEARASIELPGNALITGVSFYGEDSDAASDIAIVVQESAVAIAGLFGGTTSQTNTTLASGNTSALSGIGSTFLEIDPDVTTGATGSIFFGTSTRFYSVTATTNIAAGPDHLVCGVRVLYQVPTTGDNQVFTPLTPCAVFDSRTSQGGTGTFTGDETRSISVVGDTTAQGGTGDCGVPSSASAVQLNVLVLTPQGTGTLKLWETGAAEPDGVVAYTGEVGRWNGASVIPSASGVDIKTKTSGADVRLVATGYYSSVSNMGN